jgi:hypothetical protein
MGFIEFLKRLISELLIHQGDTDIVQPRSRDKIGLLDL